MLEDVTILESNTLLSAIAMVNGKPPGIRRVSTGVYLTPHWSFEMEVAEKLESYPDFPDRPDLSAYGVCDSIVQFFEKFPVVKFDERKFAVSFVEILKSTQESEGGWRWHKWGGYVGEQNPQCEYLYDEPEIDRVFTYHIYEVL